MARGTWQSSGTWQTSGPDPGPLVAVIGICVAAAAVYAVASWLVVWWWLVLGVVAACAAVLVAGVVALSRWTGRREARFAEQRRIQRAAQAAAELPHPQQSALPAAPQVVITGGTHLWLAGIPDAGQAVIISQPLPGQAGGAINKELP